MKRCYPLAPRRKPCGFSLIELMVALAIGLIIAVASFSAYLGASGASRMAEAQMRMNEDAQAALSVLTQQLRMAGSNPYQPGRAEDASRRNPVYGATSYPTGAYATSNFAIRGCDGTFEPSTGPESESIDNLVCKSQTAEPDSLAVSYEADIFNTTATAVGNFPSDCLGNKLNTVTAKIPAPAASGPATAPMSPPPIATLPLLVVTGPMLVVTVVTPGAAASVPVVPTPAPTPVPQSFQEVSYAVAANRFYLGVSVAQVPSLYCKGSGLNSDGTASAAQPLVENIEDMQFWYGKVATSTTALDDVKTEKIGGYLSAAEILTKSSVTGVSSDNEAQRWAKVVTVRVCVLARSEAQVMPNSASAQYLKCDGTVETVPPDLRLRRAYYATVVLRNRRF